MHRNRKFLSITRIKSSNRTHSSKSLIRLKVTMEHEYLKRNHLHHFCQIVKPFGCLCSGLIRWNFLLRILELFHRSSLRTACCQDGELAFLLTKPVSCSDFGNHSNINPPDFFHLTTFGPPQNLCSNWTITSSNKPKIILAFVLRRAMIYKLSWQAITEERHWLLLHSKDLAQDRKCCKYYPWYLISFFLGTRLNSIQSCQQSL